MRKIKYLNRAFAMMLLLGSTLQVVGKSSTSFEKQNKQLQSETSGLGDKLAQFAQWVTSTVTQVTLGAVNGVTTAVANNCPKAELKGAQQVCSNYPSTYEIKFFRGSTEVPQQYQKINWTVGIDDKILSVAGLSITLLEQNYRTQMGLPVGFPVDITQISIDAQNLRLDYQGTLSHDLSYTYSQTKGYTTVYQGDSIILGGSLSNTQTIFAQFAFKGAFTITASNITGADPGKSIVVLFSGLQTQSKVIVQYDKAIIGAVGCPGQSLELPIQIARKPTVPDIIGLPTTLAVSCLNTLNLSTSAQRDAQFVWSFDGANISGGLVSGLPGFYHGNNIYIDGFNKNGQNIVMVGAYNQCGSQAREVVVNVNPTIGFKIDGTDFTTPVLNVSCPQLEQGFRLDQNANASSKNAVKYTWTLPPGWTMYNGGSITKTETINGITRYTFGGTGLTNPQFVSLKTNNIHVASAGTVLLSLDNVCNATTSVSKAFNVTLPNQIVASLPADAITCNNTISLNATLSANARSPYKSTWSTSGLVGQFTASQITANTVTNNFTAQQFGEGRINLTIRDANGCNATASTYVKMFDGADVSGYSAGWLSGHVNPQQTKTVNSNLAISKQNRLYFSSTDGKIWFYEFNTSTKKWDVKATNMTNAKGNVKNNVRFVASGSLDFLIYIGTNNLINVARLSPSTGQSVLLTTIDGITPVNGVHGFDAKYIGFDLFELFYVDQFKGLSVVTLEMTVDKSVINSNSNLSIVGGTNVPLNAQLVDFEFDRLRDRIYYFKTDGGFYMKNITNGVLGSEVQINTVSGSLEATLGTISEFAYDDKKDVYFTANGDVYYVRFDASRNITGTYKIETVDGVPSQINTLSAASNSIAINPSTQTIYYTSKNGYIFQIVRNADFETNPSFRLLKSTPLSVKDFASSHLVYASSPEHLFYTSTSSQLYNLFYYDVAQVATCRPQYLRKAADAGFEQTAELLVPSTLNVNNVQINAFPNPFEEKLNIVLNSAIYNGKLEIYDLNGTKLMEQNFDGKTAELDLDNLSSGLYLIKLFASNLESPICQKICKK